jgi:hypothetical protein
MKVKKPGNLGGPLYNYLGHFRKAKWQRKGHNDVEEAKGTVFEEKDVQSAFRYHDPPRKRQRILNSLRNLEDEARDVDRKFRKAGDDTPETRTHRESGPAGDRRNVYRNSMDGISARREDPAAGKKEELSITADKLRKSIKKIVGEDI